MKAEEIEQKAAQWLKEKGYDRRTWKNTSQLIAKFITENNFSLSPSAEKEEEKEWEKLGFPDDNRRTEKALKNDLLHCYHCNETFTDIVKILEHYAKKHNGTPPKN